MNAETLRHHTRYVIVILAGLLSHDPVKGEPAPEPKKDQGTSSLVASPQAKMRISQMNEDSSSLYRSDHDSELRRFENAMAATNGVSPEEEARIKEYLRTLPPPAEGWGINYDDDFQRGDQGPWDFKGTQDIWDKLFKERVIPVWTGSRWMDGTLLARNGFGTSEKADRLLFSLNHEHAFFYYFLHQRGIRDLGETGGEILSDREDLMELNYVVQYDQSFGIWRITSNNPKDFFAQPVPVPDDKQTKPLPKNDR